MATNTQQVGEAVSFPGIDPRVWFARAIVQAVTVSAAGAKADVIVLPFGAKETVSIGSSFATDRAGFFFPVKIGECVFVSFPRGESNEGGVIIGSCWDRGDPLPQTAIDNPNDVALVAPADRTIRLVTTDGGKVVLESGGDTLLGNETATLGVARLTDSVQVTIPPLIPIVPNPAFPGPGQPEFFLSLLPITITGTITGASAKVKAT